MRLKKLALLEPVSWPPCAVQASRLCTMYHPCHVPEFLSQTITFTPFFVSNLTLGHGLQQPQIHHSLIGTCYLFRNRGLDAGQ